MAYQEAGSGAILSAAQAISLSTANVASTNVFDCTGAGVGNAPTMIGPINAGVLGTNTALGTDLGVGQSNFQPGVFFTVTTAGTGSGTIACAIQVAPDNGSYNPGTYTTLSQSQAFVGTAMVAGNNALNFWLPLPPVPSNYGIPTPRFLRVLYIGVGVAAVSMDADFMTNPPDVQSVLQYGKNFSSAY